MVALALPIVAGLTACTPESEIAIRLVEQELDVVVCDEVSANSIVVWAVGDDGGDAEVVWDASGPERTFGPDDVIRIGQAPSEWSASEVGEDLRGARKIAVSVGIVKQGEYLSGRDATFTGDLASARWIDPSGSKSDEPCGADQ